MSQESALKFFVAMREHPAMLVRYGPRNLSQLLFHAKNDGFDFSADDLSQVIGKLEAHVILAKDGDPFDGTSRLWRTMWGRNHMQYLVDHVVRRHTDAELQELVTAAAAEAK